MTLTVTCSGVLGSPLRGPVTLLLSHLQRDHGARADLVPGKRAEIAGLLPGHYKLQALSDVHHDVGRIVAADAGTVHLELPLRAEFAVPVFPDYPALPQMLRNLVDGQRWDWLTPVQRAGLCNVLAKCARTVIDGTPVSDLITTITDIRQDRLFCLMDETTAPSLARAADDGVLSEVSGALHDPPEGYEPWGSYKTKDRYGNLQITLFRQWRSWAADIDIDDAAGLEHVWQVVRNHATGQATHPYDIHQILVAHQGLHPGYDLGVAETIGA